MRGFRDIQLWDWRGDRPDRAGRGHPGDLPLVDIPGGRALHHRAGDCATDVSEPFWRQKTFWVSVAGLASAAASAVTPRYRDLLLALGVFFGCVGSMTARQGGVEAAQELRADTADAMGVSERTLAGPGG